MKNTILITIIVASLVGAVAFFAGVKYQQSKVPSRRFGNLQQGQAGQFQQGNTGLPAGRQGFRPVNGEIISRDDSSITVKMEDGSSKIVLFSDKTEINKAAEASQDDLKVGEKVAVFGQENPDGSITAQNIQLNPILRGGPIPTQAQ